MDLSPVTVVALAAVALGLVGALVGMVRSLIVICMPNEMVVVSGRRRVTEDGRSVGYRVLHGGRTLRVPIIEKVSRIDLRTIPIEVMIKNAYSKGGIPLIVQGIANVKVCAREPISYNAVERLLDKPFDEIMQIAKDTLEGNLRGVLATLTPEEVNEDRLKFAQRLIEEADEDLKKLGLELDTLKIQNVTDDVKYLDSIGRTRTAEILKIARVAEAQRTSEAEQTEASSRQAAQIAKIQADLKITEENNRLRVRKAELEAEALARENEAQVAGEKAKVKAQQDLQAARIDLEAKRVEADVVVPARADREASELRAKGAAASILENGNANLAVLDRMIQLYSKAGNEAERIFILNMLPEIIKELAGSVEQIKIDKLAIEGATGINILSRLQKPAEQPKRAEK